MAGTPEKIRLSRRLSGFLVFVLLGRNPAFLELSLLQRVNRPSSISNWFNRRSALGYEGDSAQSSIHSTKWGKHRLTGRTSVSLGKGISASQACAMAVLILGMSCKRSASERIAANSTLDAQISRRNAIVLPAGLACTPAPACALAQAPALPETEVGSIFVGRYTDPNHPGGYRDIRLLGNGKAEVTGGGGIFEPKFFTLPATVAREVGKSGVVDSITINFLPKGGPPNFKGVWDKDGITFLLDRNHWPKQQ
eukprot:TRINITY_DN43112_c0_g1_i1.p1 TRINITY_DN43112_c0_g1~~TRINITY_DN43112_c0_g1_i1.p1  ORF type:complete len:252 (+),score=29.44 TRINITY_DN43112_c0_g1_i1:104-859(+)